MSHAWSHACVHWLYSVRCACRVQTIRPRARGREGRPGAVERRRIDPGHPLRGVPSPAVKRLRLACERGHAVSDTGATMSDTVPILEVAVSEACGCGCACCVVRRAREDLDARARGERRGPSRVITFRVDEELWAWVCAYAEARGVTRSDVIRAAFLGFVDECSSGVPELARASR
jgi:hypothetical protein